MSGRVLIAYATRYGSTREVAEAVAATLSERGLEADVRPAREVAALDAYAAIVLGAPLYMFHWHKDALGFLARHRGALASRPLAIFALGPLHDDERERRGALEQLEKELAKHPWLRPVEVRVFVGKYDPAKLGFLHKLLAALPASPLHNLPASDERDWPGIRGWAGGLTGALQLAR